MDPERLFLGWDGPLSERAAQWLLERAGGGAWPDLSRWLVVVPTQESGRILRGALCVRRPEGFLAPRVVTPMELYRRGDSGRWAGRTARLWVWTQLLLSREGIEEGPLLPGWPAERDFAWALGVARSLCQAQDLLSEGALTFSRARDAAGQAEPELWLRLARLEERYRELLALSGLRDPTEARLELLDQALWDFDGYAVALVGCPDPHPLAVRLLEASAPGRPCFVLIHAPEEIAEGFDRWGRPEAGFWQRRRLPFLPSTRIYAEEGEVARRAADLVATHCSWDAVTIGVCASGLRPYLRLILEERKIPAFDPGGIPARASSWASLFADLREFARERSVAAFRRLLCHPAMADWLGVSDGSRSFFLEKLDRAMFQTLSKDLRSAARREPVLEPLAKRMEHFLAEAEEDPLAAIGDLFEELFSRKGGGNLPGTLSEELTAALEEMDLLRGSAAHLPNAGEVLDLLLDRLSQLELPERRPDQAVELRGWLELLWDDGPHLILAGFQEGAVPESTAHDFLLPATLRERLGLRTNAQREARDAYLFEALVAQRRERGRVDVLACRFSREGEPLFPSRLLLRCPPEELPERVRRVLKAQPSPRRRQPAATDSFPLRIGPLRWEREKRLSITALRDYLSCPFFFFLRRARRWESVERLPEELDPREFGSLLHEVLADFGRADEMKACDRRETIEEFLRSLLSRRLRQRFPEGVPPAVVIQAGSLEGRLAGFARAQAEEVRRGWRTIFVEEAISFSIRDWEIEGRIDRVDQDERGRMRLLDFKSADRAPNPKWAHLCAAERRDGAAEGLFQWEGKQLRWKELQLPLYAAAWRRKNSGSADLEVGYFVLPKDRDQAGVRQWNEWSRRLETEAEACAARIAHAVEEGRFWPPRSSAEWMREPWVRWFDGRPEELVSPVRSAD